MLKQAQKAELAYSGRTAKRSGESTLAQTSVTGVVYVIEPGVSTGAEGLQICIAVDLCLRLTGRRDIDRGHRMRVDFRARV